jgi:2-polyprenyl-6-methoxyphenol hydroxylase-like FAD-dependent oxidoreductase
LAGIGIEVPEQVEESPATYATRFYRLRPGARPRDGGYRIGRRAGLSYGTFPADNQTHSVSLFVPPRHKDLRRRVMDPANFDSSCSLIPEVAPYVDPTAVEPITAVNPMAGLINRLRSFTGSDGLPTVTGFVALGDAYMVTNPTYGRGCSIAMLQAAALADATGEHGEDPMALAQAYEAFSAERVSPWYYLSVLADQVTAAADDGADLAIGPGSLPEGSDGATQVAFARILMLLDPPQKLYTDPALIKLLTRPAFRRDLTKEGSAF